MRDRAGSRNAHLFQPDPFHTTLTVMNTLQSGLARRVPRLLACSLALVLLTAGCDNSDLLTDAAPETAARNANTGEIVFASERNGNFEIYTMNTDGTGLTRLTFSDATDSRPAWSPDGKHIVFTIFRDGNAEIYTMDADGSDLTRLTFNDADDTSPAWSPKGSNGGRIVFTSTRDGNAEIYTMNTDGSDLTRLTFNDASDSSPHWTK